MENNMYKKFELFMQERGLSPYRIAKEAGVSQPTLSDWKHGKSEPKRATLEKICNAYDLPISYFYEDTTETHMALKKNDIYEAQNDTERKILMLCRKAGDAPEEEKEAIIRQFESTIDMYLQAKGIKRG